MAAATIIQNTTLQWSGQSNLKLQVDGQNFLEGSSKPVWHGFNSSIGFWHSVHKPLGRKFLPPGLRIPESVSMLETRQKCLAIQAGSKGGLRSKALWEMQDPKRMPADVCPCGGGIEKDRYQTCCARFHKNGLFPTTALLLMRSRYTAYVKGLVDYLVDTTHPDHPDYDTMRKSVRDTVNRVRFKKLEIQDFANGENEVSMLELGTVVLGSYFLLSKCRTLSFETRISISSIKMMPRGSSIVAFSIRIGLSGTCCSCRLS
eukprot:TRINITY_DN284_c0_g1_i1.p1 TRINITY_DN284_c0_g1~~TRINITY_DN284_c0_g1_i1.p1  ORF type:complete len:260 (-),score=0.42 TRINITY_DN284_c0_g1_i1:644-1423(-)